MFFLSRECVRRVALRRHPADAPRSIALGLITIAVGLLLTAAGLVVTLLLPPPLPHAHGAYLLQAASVALDVLQEPFFALLTATQAHARRLPVDIPVLVLRQLAAAALASRFPDAVLLVVAGTNALASALTTGLYALCFRLPAPDTRALSRTELADAAPAAALFARQTLQKLLLQEGEKAALLATVPLAAQGAHALLANLAALVIRLLLAPIDDVAYATFARLRPAPSDARAAFALLTRLVCYVALLAAAFGIPFTPALRRVRYGATAEPPTPTLLVLTFAGIAATALNGITEAFFHATARKTALAQANNVMLAFSVGYILLCIAFATAWGAPGVVAANAVMMTVRTAYNVRQIVSQHGALDVPAVLPPPAAVAAVAVAFIGNVVFVSQTQLRSALVFGVGCLVGCAVLAVLFVLDRPLFNQIKAMLHKPK